MSRKWERMVEKNAKKVNKTRQKQGKPSLSAGQSDIVVVKGRSLMLPAAFILIALFFVMTTPPQTGGSYWFMILSYPALAALYFFVYRPYLKVGKDWLGIRRWFMEERVQAKDVKSIERSAGHITVTYEKRGKTARMVFSKALNLYSIDRLDEVLRKLAGDHGITYELQDK